MVMIKEHINKFEKNQKPWAKVIKWILGILAVLFLIGFFLTQMPEQVEVETPKYHVRVSNSIGGDSYYCESYTLDGNTYKLFDGDSTLTNEITITDGYVVQINLSE